jgi:hypothetical protein
VTREMYGGVSLREYRFSMDLLQDPPSSQAMFGVSTCMQMAQRQPLSRSQQPDVHTLQIAAARRFDLIPQEPYQAVPAVFGRA